VKIYRITNKTNGKIYIGQTRHELSERWRSHVWEAFRGKKQWALSCAIRKYGAVAFGMEVLYVAKTQRELNKMETFFIVLYQSHKPENGYNLTMGGDGLSYWKGKKRSPETIAKILATKRKNGTIWPPNWNQDLKLIEKRVATRRKKDNYSKPKARVEIQKQKKETPTVAFFCDFCGGVQQVERWCYNERKKKSKSGKLFCSLSCGQRAVFSSQRAVEVARRRWAS
jgi:group I intron endonuclease